MKKTKEMYSYPTLGNWLKETLRWMNFSQEEIRKESHIGKTQLEKLLKGGHEVQLLGTCV